MNDITPAGIVSAIGSATSKTVQVPSDYSAEPSDFSAAANPNASASAARLKAQDQRQPVPAGSPFSDPAKNILAATDGLSEDQKADVWDTYHGSKTSAELASKLQQHAFLPDAVRQSLFVAKAATDAPKSAVNKTIDAVHRLAAIPIEMLNFAEAHPVVLKHLTDAVLKD
jgi:hypothetical protein